LQEDDAVAEGACLGELKYDPAVRFLEQRLSPADDDRVDIEAVLVDQVVTSEGVGEIGPTERQVAPGCDLSCCTSSVTSSRRMVVFQSARSRVLECTIFPHRDALRAARNCDAALLRRRTASRIDPAHI
jgi:hypothetical protein